MGRFCRSRFGVDGIDGGSADEFVDPTNERLLAEGDILVAWDFSGQFTVRDNYKRGLENGHDQRDHGAELFRINDDKSSYD